MDPELQQLFNLVVSKGINIFDTADSYGGPVPLLRHPSLDNASTVYACMRMQFAKHDTNVC